MSEHEGKLSLLVALLLAGFIIPTMGQPYYTVKISLTGGFEAAQYSLQIYNATGYPVSYLGSIYSEMAASLPSGVHLFMASAWSYEPEPYYTSSYLFGYGVYNIQGDGSVSINLTPPEQMRTVQVQVKALFPNTSPVSGAYVSAYPVGGLWFPEDATKLYETTGEDGTATLIVPEVPLTVSIYASIPVPTPSNIPPIQVEIGGETIEIQAYYPQAVSFAAQALLIPPFPGQTVLTLHYQPDLCLPYADGVRPDGTVTYPCPITYASGTEQIWRPTPPTTTTTTPTPSEGDTSKTSTRQPIPPMDSLQQSSAETVGTLPAAPILSSIAIVTGAATLLAAQISRRARKKTTL